MLKFYGLCSKGVRCFAYQIAKAKNIQCLANWEKDQMAAIEWLRSYKSRHPELTPKKPEACSVGRATAFDKETARPFFDNLKNVVECHLSFCNGCRIFNLDKTTKTTVQEPQKVMAPRGKHNICKITGGERDIVAIVVYEVL